MTEPMFIPTEAGALDVRRRARRRRRRQVVLAAAAVAAIALSGSLLALPGVGRGADRLSVVPASPSPRAAASHLPHASPSGRRSPLPQQQPQGTGKSRPASTSANPNNGPAPEDSPTPTAPARKHSAAAPITRTTVAFTSQCDATNDIAGWCQVYSGPGSARRKHPVSLSIELCRMPVAGDGQVTFSDTREVSFFVYTYNGTTVWQAGQGVKNSQREHTVTVRGGTCLRWAATWDTIDRAGFYAPPGEYSMGYAVDSSNMTSFTSGDTLQLTD